jgi:hypothetical protein
MSRLNKGLYSSDSQTWETPSHVWQAILDFEGLDKFDVDVATTEMNVPCRYGITEDGVFHSTSDSEYECINDDDGLTSEWNLGYFNDAICWMNPPYGDMLKKFMKKAFEESQNGCKIWALIPARTETIYQHEYGLTQAGFTVFLKGRLHFLQNGEDKGSAPFPTMLLYYGDDARVKAKRWVSNPPLEGTLMRKEIAK